MERISAACAMEWSIELEKALRSRKPGLSVQAILKMGPRLVQWSGEPEPTKAVYDMFGLLPGEDRLFANTILLRLLDAFKAGDKHIRLSVVKVFLSEYRQRRKKKKTKQCKGILSKGRLHNHVEMFKRAKLVFDTGDVESRALALILFGCWVEFAKDNAHIRYLILSSLVSSDVLEVKASLFAAGCFCELADDFAAVVLEILLNLMASSSTLAVRLAAARIFTKMGCSYSTANKAYETGLKMLSGSSDEDFLTAMLISLSKLASKSTLLLPKQVDLVLSFLSRERTLRMRATALRCLHFLTTKGAYHPVSACVIKTLVGIADDHGLPGTMQCEVLQIWHKMILYTSPDVPCDDIHEFSHLFAIFENSTEPPILSKRLLAARILTDVFTKLRRKTGTGFSKVGSPPMSLQVISLTVDQIIFLLKSLLEQSHSDFRELQQVQSLLIPLFSLVGENPDLGVLVLDKICTFIESLMDIHSRVMAASEEGSLVQDTQVPERGKSRAIVLKLDLAGRLWHVDSETCTDLSILSEACAQPKNCFHWQSRSRMFNVGGMRDTLTVCRDAVSHFLRLQNQANKMQEEITFHVIEDGLQLLSNILMKWICIPFRIPKYYFEVRPCIGSELFAFNAGSSIPNEISVVPGFHLSFNLCLQLRNVPPHLSVSLTKLYCILCCRVSLQEPRLNGQKREPAQQYSQPWKDENEMVELNEKLFCHVAKCSKRSHRGKPACDNDVESGTVNTFLSFELSERGQGFSSCLLDVSHFPLGSYRIKWHSCCIDKRGRYRSLLPLNGGPVFEVRNPVVG